MNKDIQKSIRMTAEVYAYVDAQPGTGFNAKFENMVLRCMTEESELEKKIEKKKEELAKLERNCEDIWKVLDKAKRIERFLNEAMILVRNS